MIHGFSACPIRAQLRLLDFMTFGTIFVKFPHLASAGIRKLGILTLRRLFGRQVCMGVGFDSDVTKLTKLFSM